MGRRPSCLCSLDKARRYAETPIKVLASAQASDTLALHSRADICTFEATRFAARKAYKQANIGPQDIQLAEVHDNFTISEILAIEDLGFFDKGQGRQGGGGRPHQAGRSGGREHLRRV